MLPCSSEDISSLKRRGQGLQVSPARHVGPAACFPSSLWSPRAGRCGFGVVSVSSSVKGQEPALAVYAKGVTRWTCGGSDRLHGASGTGSESEREPQTALGRRPPPGTASTVAPSETRSQWALRCSLGQGFELVFGVNGEEDPMLTAAHRVRGSLKPGGSSRCWQAAAAAAEKAGFPVKSDPRSGAHRWAARPRPGSPPPTAGPLRVDGGRWTSRGDGNPRQLRFLSFSRTVGPPRDAELRPSQTSIPLCDAPRQARVGPVIAAAFR